MSRISYVLNVVLAALVIALLFLLQETGRPEQPGKRSMLMGLAWRMGLAPPARSEPPAPRAVPAPACPTTLPMAPDTTAATDTPPAAVGSRPAFQQPRLSASGQAQRRRAIFVAAAHNPLWRLLQRANREAVRAGTLLRVERAAQVPWAALGERDALFLLAGSSSHPEDYDPALWARPNATFRVFVEFSRRIPGTHSEAVLESGLQHSPAQLRECRAVVTDASSLQKFGLHNMDILDYHGSMYLVWAGLAPRRVLLTTSSVAGVHRAVYGVQSVLMRPTLFFSDGSQERILIMSTRASSLGDARLQPVPFWVSLWRYLLHEHAGLPGVQIPPYTLAVHATYGPSAPLPQGAQLEAVRRATDYLHRECDDEICQFHRGPKRCPTTDPKFVGVCMSEGWSGSIYSDGRNNHACHTRTDTNGEGTFALGVRVMLEKDNQTLVDSWRKDIQAMHEYQFLYSDMQSTKESGNPEIWRGLVKGLFVLCSGPAPGFGLDQGGHKVTIADPLDQDRSVTNSNSTIRPFIDECSYGDDASRWGLGNLAAMAAINDFRFSNRALEIFFALLRMTGTEGWRPWRLDYRNFGGAWDSSWFDREYGELVQNLKPHYQFSLWAMFFRLSQHLHIAAFGDRAALGVARWLSAFPASVPSEMSGRCDAMQMVWPLAWRVRWRDTPQHRKELRKIVDTLYAYVHPCGAIPDGSEPRGFFFGGAPPGSNDAYVTSECVVFQSPDGDNITDSLYGLNFFFFGVHEAWAATGDEHYKKIADALADFYIRIQLKAPVHIQQDGAWTRGFDLNYWEPGDYGWNSFGIENSWTVTFITWTLAFRELGTDMWTHLGKLQFKDPVALCKEFLRAPKSGLCDPQK